MEYRPGGYSWLAVAPESSFEQQIEKIEDQIYALHQEFEKTGNTKLLNKIQILKEQIKNMQP